MKQDDLAKAVKVSKSFVSEIENDHAVPGGEILLRLAETLGATTDYILKGGGSVEATTATAPKSVPPELAELADRLNLSYRTTITLLDARRLVLARRGRQEKQSWESEDWLKLYEKLKDYLE
jgi:transcriptional regulator with XRE-family HTH domain